LVGTYALVQEPHGSLQAVAGARVLDLGEELGWEVSGNVGSIPLEARQGHLVSDLLNWDAVVGLRGRLLFGADRWFVSYYADVGAGDSDGTWQVVAGLGHSFRWGDVLAAWRHVDYQLQPGQAIESVTFDGPAVGFAIRW
jgi:hypothetical protein